VKRYITILWAVLFLLGLGLGSQNPLAQEGSNQQEKEILTDQNTTPSQFHKMMGEMKQKRLDQLRKLGKRIRTEETLDQSQFDAKYYKLDLTLNDTTQIVSGSVYMYAQALVGGFINLELNFFDNPSMYIDSIKTNSTLLSFSWNNDLIHITLDRPYNNQEPFDVTVYYHGHPLEGGLQSFDWSTHGSPSVPVISTLSEPYFSQSWWPCKDMPRDKADSADINITVRSDLIVASNGLLREVIDHGTTKTYKWHEKYPITTYLIMIATTNYTIFSNWYYPISQPGDSMEVRYFVYPEYLSNAQSLYPVTPSMIEFFANTFGEYPFVDEKYGMAHFTWGGAMEHQTCTSILYSWYSQWVIAHELSHQWWGDYITCHNWHHIWLHEGFASYCEALWAEHAYGESYYHTYMGNMKYTSGGTIFIQDTTDAWTIFGTIVYDKGAWVLHMLRHVVGDSTFFDILRAYYSEFPYGVAMTEDFQGVCEQVSGMDLDYFFQEWIYGTYYPKYRFSWVSQSAGSGYYDVYLHIDQTQTTPPTYFTMPVDVTITAGGLDTTFVVFNDPRHKDFQFRVYGSPNNLRLDKDEWILRTTTLTAYTLNIVTTDLPPGTQLVSFDDTLIAKGGTLPYIWSLVSGNLPDGLTLDSLTGIIAGTPSVLDSFDFMVKVKDSTVPQKADTQELYIKIEPIIRGDINHDGETNVIDVTYLINYLFMGGPEPIPLESGDVNCNGVLNIIDVVYLINYIFIDGPPPC
jgi:aminopeptidase N